MKIFVTAIEVSTNSVTRKLRINATQLPLPDQVSDRTFRVIAPDPIT
jgi:hypothetical protein